MKTLSVRQFKNRFGVLNETLKPGQAVTVTKHRKPCGVWQKTPERTVPRPQFAKRVAGDKYPAATAEQLLAKLDEAVL